jgi:hypothetical protein
MKAGVDKFFFNPADKKVLPKHHLQIWPGYFYTVDEFEDGIFLMVSLIRGARKVAVENLSFKFKPFCSSVCIHGQTLADTTNPAPSFQL